MSPLPKALQPWSDQLSIFPDELVLALGPWLPRLALAIGPLRKRERPGLGEPNGYSGLARRGPPERLLTSEWGLALEEPDEFMRRLAMSENLYLELARREPAGSTKSVVLFDAGPSQIGGPRLLHLAALIVLAQRAREANAELSFAVLQSQRKAPIMELNEQSVLSLIAGRSAYEPSQEQIVRWVERCTAGKQAPDDLWLVGGHRLAQLMGTLKGSRLEVIEPVAPGSRTLIGRVFRGEDPPRGVELQLPPDRSATRLLRNPFEVALAKGAVLRAERMATPSILLAQNGRRLFTRSAAGVIAYAIPNREGDAIALPRHLSARDQQVVGVGGSKRSTVLVTSDQKHLSVLGYSHKGRLDFVKKSAELPAGLDFWHPSAETPLLPVLSFAGGVAGMDAVGRLYHIGPGEPAKAELLLTGCLAIAQYGSQLVFVADHSRAQNVLSADDGTLRRKLPDGLLYGRLSPSRAPFVLAQRHDVINPSAFVGTFRGMPEAAIEVDFGRWSFGMGANTVDVPDRHEVIGFEGDTGALVALDPNRSRIVFFGRGARPGIDLDGTVAFATARGTRVACVMRDGSLIVIGTTHGRALLRIMPLETKS